MKIWNMEILERQWRYVTFVCMSCRMFIFCWLMWNDIMKVTCVNQYSFYKKTHMKTNSQLCQTMDIRPVEKIWQVVHMLSLLLLLFRCRNETTSSCINLQDREITHDAIKNYESFKPFHFDGVFSITNLIFHYTTPLKCELWLPADFKGKFWRH